VDSAASASHYPFDNAAPQAGDRFASLAKLYDGVTRRHLDQFGMGAGQRCLEVGAGGGSVARFMSERVGPAGHVVATDINIDWMSGSQPGNVELRRHDIGVDPLPERAFDIVHARAVLTFVPERRSALMRMIAALKPGGWLLVEELVPPVIDALIRPTNPTSRLRGKAVAQWSSSLDAAVVIRSSRGSLRTREGRRAHRNRCGGLLRPVSHRRRRWAR
jgi:ubiquinone/menaquinone biosynthesis C-methylase UbiE